MTIDLDPGSGRQERRDEIQAVVHPQAQIDEGQVEGPPGIFGQGVGDVAHADDTVAIRFQGQRQNTPDVDLVVDDENVERSGLARVRFGTHGGSSSGL